MTKRIIPWNIFQEEFSKRPKSRLAEWLAMWRFTDEGAYAELDSLKLGKYANTNAENRFVELPTFNSSSQRILQ